MVSNKGKSRILVNFVIKAVKDPTSAPKTTDPIKTVKNCKTAKNKTLGSISSPFRREAREYSSMERQRTMATASFKRLSPKMIPDSDVSAFKSYKIQIRITKEMFHTVRNLHFLSKNSTLISRENYRFFGGEKLVKMLWFGTF